MSAQEDLGSAEDTLAAESLATTCGPLAERRSRLHRARRSDP